MTTPHQTRNNISFVDEDDVEDKKLPAKSPVSSNENEEPLLEQSNMEVEAVANSGSTTASSVAVTDNDVCNNEDSKLENDKNTMSDKDVILHMLFNTSDTNLVQTQQRQQNEASMCVLSCAEKLSMDSLNSKPFKLVLQKSPDLINTDSPPWRYLRFAQDDPEVAARRLVKYWEMRSEVFNDDDAWLLPLNQSGFGALNSVDLEVIRTGFMAVLPEDDDGLPVLCVDRSRLQDDFYELHSVTASIKRCAFYFLSVIAEHEVAQSRGVRHLLILDQTCTLGETDRVLLKTNNELITHALPLKIDRIDVVMKSPRTGKRHFLEDIVPAWTELVKPAQDCQVDFKVHSGVAKKQAINDLMARGFNAECLPKGLGGEWGYYDDFEHWRRYRSVYEQTMLTVKNNPLAFDEENGHVRAAIEIVREENARNRKRSMDAVYARRKRQKKKNEKDTVQRMLEQQRSLREELLQKNSSLEILLAEAKQIATAHDTEKTSNNFLPKQQQQAVLPSTMDILQLLQQNSGSKPQFQGTVDGNLLTSPNRSNGLGLDISAQAQSMLALMQPMSPSKARSNTQNHMTGNLLDFLSKNNTNMMTPMDTDPIQLLLQQLSNSQQQSNQNIQLQQQNLALQLLNQQLLLSAVQSNESLCNKQSTQLHHNPLLMQTNGLNQLQLLQMLQQSSGHEAGSQNILVNLMKEQSQQQSQGSNPSFNSSLFAPDLLNKVLSKSFSEPRPNNLSATHYSEASSVPRMGPSLPLNHAFPQQQEGESRHVSVASTAKQNQTQEEDSDLLKKWKQFVDGHFVQIKQNKSQQTSAANSQVSGRGLEPAEQDFRIRQLLQYPPTTTEQTQTQRFNPRQVEEKNSMPINNYSTEPLQKSNKNNQMRSLLEVSGPLMTDETTRHSNNDIHNDLLRNRQPLNQQHLQSKSEPANNQVEYRQKPAHFIDLTQHQLQETHRVTQDQTLNQHVQSQLLRSPNGTTQASATFSTNENKTNSQFLHNNGFPQYIQFQQQPSAFNDGNLGTQQDSSSKMTTFNNDESFNNCKPALSFPNTATYPNSKNNINKSPHKLDEPTATAIKQLLTISNSLNDSQQISNNQEVQNQILQSLLEKQLPLQSLFREASTSQQALQDIPLENLQKLLQLITSSASNDQLNK